MSTRARGPAIGWRSSATDARSCSRRRTGRASSTITAPIRAKSIRNRSRRATRCSRRIGTGWLRGVPSGQPSRSQARASACTRSATCAEAAMRGVAQALVLLAGLVAWTAYVHRQLDYRIRSPWRQADYTGIARGFAREGLDILYPRIDWRGAGPGYVEGEFPLLLRAFGDRPWLLRLPPLACTITSLFVFYGLARRLLPPAGVLLATAAFAA